VIGAYGFRILDFALVGQVFVINAGVFDMDINAIQKRAADFLLVAGDRYGGIATFFDRVTEKSTRTPVWIAVVNQIIRATQKYFLSFAT
jgi:hypothetical protein